MPSSVNDRARVLVVGGVAAGLSAALRARRLDPSLAITVFERTGYCSYTACGLPYLISGTIRDQRALVVRQPAALREQGIDIQLHHEVSSLDLPARRATVRDLHAGGERDVEFDQLVLATGSAPVAPFRGAELPGCFTLRTVESALAVNDWIERRRPSRAVIIGGSFLGLEMAEALLARGIQVTLIDAARQLIPSIDPDLAELVEDELRSHAVSVRTGANVVEIAGAGEGVRQVVLEDCSLPCEMVVIGVGVRPEASLATAAGIPTGARGAIAVDAHMRTPIDGVWAAGDVCETRHLLKAEPSYLPLWTTANKQGRVAGSNIGGGEETFQGVVGTAAVKVCDLEIARTGLSTVEATEAGIDVAAVTVTHKSRAGYYPGSQPITVRMLADRSDGRLLGAQLCGREGVAKRVDVVAAALHGRASAEDVAGYDLSYAPPFSPVWDPLLIAARQLTQSL
jgi:CoA-dependent NAD(P)H sulfur oxidoreductase